MYLQYQGNAGIRPQFKFRQSAKNHLQDLASCMNKGIPFHFFSSGKSSFIGFGR
jgi:hypothetical protein